MRRTEYDHAINRYHSRFIHEKLCKLDISRPEGQYLIKIYKAGGRVLMNDMVGESVFHKSHATRAINDLVENGLVLKEKNPDDKRGYFLALTEKGKENAIKVKTIIDEWDSFVNSVITDEEREMMQNITKKIYHLLINFYNEEDMIDENSI
jgi:DNA-binding MarR family transcriptional regulator